MLMEQDRSNERRPGFDESMAGKRAECDGGGMVPGSHFAGREEFTGTLTGQYYDQGDPAWRWYLMGELTRKPENFTADAVWCESESLFLLDEDEENPPRTNPEKTNER